MIPFKNSVLSYSDEGKGHPVVLLHGYLETKDIWSDFARELAKYFRVIAIDIPGHGKSGKVSDVHTVELIAEAVDWLLKTLKVPKAFVIGHSMGGYAGLAFLAQYPAKVSGLCLFHSTPFADTEEKKANRDREIALIRQGQQNIVFETNVPKGFANDNLQRLKEKVEWAKSLAAQCPPEGIIALLEGLKIRPDRQSLLKETSAPLLFILGKKDNYIPHEIMVSVAQRSPCSEHLLLGNSGHLGFLEEPQPCLETLKSFIGQHSKQV